jgi:hypothetical protein
MLRKLVSAVVVLVLIAVVGTAQEKKGRPAGSRGKIVKFDVDKGVLTVLVKKSREDEGTKTDFTITKDTKFQMGAGRGKEPTAVTSPEEIKEKFKEGGVVRLTLDVDGKTVKTATVMAARGKKKNTT